MKKTIDLVPNNFDELIGASVNFNKGSLIRKMIENNSIISFLFFGPPGTGKSLTIKLLLKKLNLNYHYFNSSSDKKKDLEEILQKTKSGEKPIIVVEEIHRLNKDKQDILLYYLEKDLITIAATTTENPYFVVNPAIRSRIFLYEIKRLDDQLIIDELTTYLKTKKINLDKVIIEKIVVSNFGDFRKIFSCINLVLEYYKEESTDTILKMLSNNVGSNIDIENTVYYDFLSAFHKSLRGSDPDAAVYYLACLLQNNNLLPIFRRLYAVAYEDVGLANPELSSRVHAAIEAAKALGLPEARIPLSAITIELALSPKSNSAINAIDKAIATVEKNHYFPPKHICDNHYSNAVNLGVNGYKYPHNYNFNWVDQDYLPKEIKNEKFYIYNKFSLFESKQQQYWKTIKKEREK